MGSLIRGMACVPSSSNSKKLGFVHHDLPRLPISKKYSIQLRAAEKVITSRVTHTFATPLHILFGTRI